MANVNAIVNRKRPAATAEQLQGAVGERNTPYGDRAMVQYNTERNALADEGSYYTVTNPTIDTGVGAGVITAYVVTTPFFHIGNTDTPGAAGARTIFLDYLRLRPTVAPASATNWKMVVDVDSSPRLSTAPTGGANRTVNNLNPAMPNDFPGQVWAFTGGTVVTVMGALSVRTLYHATIAQSIPVVADEYLITFGVGFEMGLPHLATITKKYVNCPPVVIPPGCSASIHMYGASNAITGISLEYDLGMWAR